MFLEQSDDDDFPLPYGGGDSLSAQFRRAYKNGDIETMKFIYTTALTNHELNQYQRNSMASYFMELGYDINSSDDDEFCMVKSVVGTPQMLAQALEHGYDVYAKNKVSIKQKFIFFKRLFSYDIII
jgi:hypothetical protein